MVVLYAGNFLSSVKTLTTCDNVFHKVQRIFLHKKLMKPDSENCFPGLILLPVSSLVLPDLTSFYTLSRCTDWGQVEHVVSQVPAPG